MNSAVETGRVALRPYTDADREAMGRLLTDERIRKNYMLPDFQSPEQIDQMFEKLKRWSRDDSHFERGIYLEDQLVGFVNDVEIEGDAVELGYAVSPDAQGNGYATEALRLAIQALFARGFRSVTACAFEDNAASFRVMEKCGMTLTGRASAVAYRGETRRCIYYAIERPGGGKDR